MARYDLAALIVQFIFFALGIYVYLFSRGFVKPRKKELQERAEAFRKDNAGWMRFLGLALAAVMLGNIIVQLSGR